MRFVDLKLGLGDGIINAVMDVEVSLILIMNAVTSYIALICKDKCCCKRTYRDARSFVVITDGCNYLTDLFGRE